MKQILIGLFLLVAAFTAQSQNAYSDVAVIVNDNSTTSLAIGNYFAQQRGITPNRVLHITAPTTKDIDSLQFEAMRAQIEAALITGNLLDTINYLVTTKGMPARASVRNGCDTLYPLSMTAFNRCTCAEAELSLILGPLAGHILKTTGLQDPYNDGLTAFDRDSTGIFLVSRLDGYTITDVNQLIDNGGPNRQFSIASAKVVVDASGFAQGDPLASVYAQITSMVATDFIGYGYNVIDDADPLAFVPSGTDVIHYLGQHNADSVTTNVIMDFLPGSSASMYLDFSPIEGANPNKFTAGDAIRQGAAVVPSLLGVGYNGANFHPSIFMKWYGDTSLVHRNAAESFGLSMFYLRGQSVLYGDPKTSVSTSTLLGLPSPETIDMQIYPNPTAGSFAVVLGTAASASQSQVQILDLQGKVVYSADHKGVASFAVDATSLPAGLYIVKVQQRNASVSQKLSIVH